MTKYTLFQHRHNFAVWAAARASQRAFTTVKKLRDALESCDLKTIVQTPESGPDTAKSFDEKHKEWCEQIAAHLEESGVENPTYGRAAKLVAIYLKAMVVAGGYDETDFAKVLHPPIDRLLLQALASDKQFDGESRTKWREVNWTQLDTESYFDLIASLRQHGPKLDAFWKLEQYWDVTS